MGRQPRSRNDHKQGLRTGRSGDRNLCQSWLAMGRRLEYPLRRPALRKGGRVMVLFSTVADHMKIMTATENGLFCAGRHAGRTSCDLSHLPLEQVEDAG